MRKVIAVLPGDGIGPEVMSAAVTVLRAVAERFNHTFDFREGAVGGAAFDRFGVHFPEVTRELCATSDAVLFGSVGGPIKDAHLPKWRGCEANSILAIRKAFSFYANLRPAKVYPELAGICPLKPEIVQRGVDLLIVRELNGDIYFGEHATFERNGRRVATDVAEYTEDQIEAIAVVAFEAARKRRSHLTSVDKANVLDTSKLWRTVVHEVAARYPDVQCEDMLVDNCAMQIIRNPAQFDVIVTANLFGDILSDAAAVLPGSLGLTPSASFGSSGLALYEPSGGSAPDIAGKGVANPIAQLLSAAMMLRFSFQMIEEANAIEDGVAALLRRGIRTADITAHGERSVGTEEFARLLCEHIASISRETSR